MEIFKQILHKIKEYDTIIIHRHMRPDPDALGSQVGLKNYFKSIFQRKRLKQQEKLNQLLLGWLPWIRFQMMITKML